MHKTPIPTSERTNIVFTLTPLSYNCTEITDQFFLPKSVQRFSCRCVQSSDNCNLSFTT